jgi:hypothetical protein
MGRVTHDKQHPPSKAELPYLMRLLAIYKYYYDSFRIGRNQALDVSTLPLQTVASPWAFFPIAPAIKSYPQA